MDEKKGYIFVFLQCVQLFGNYLSKCTVHLLVNVKELKKCDLSYDSEDRNLLNARLVSLRSTYQSFLPQTPACVGVVPISAVDANLFIKSNLLKHQ